MRNEYVQELKDRIKKLEQNLTIEDGFKKMRLEKIEELRKELEFLENGTNEERNK